MYVNIIEAFEGFLVAERWDYVITIYPFFFLF